MSYYDKKLARARETTMLMGKVVLIAFPVLLVTKFFGIW